MTLGNFLTWSQFKSSNNFYQSHDSHTKPNTKLHCKTDMQVHIITHAPLGIGLYSKAYART